MILPTCMIILSIYIHCLECSHRFELEPNADGYIGSTRTKFIMYTQKVTFNEARTVCQDIGGDLAIIDSQQALDSILELVDEKYNSRNDFFRDDYWLGIVQLTAGNFYWVTDCSPLSWTSYYATGFRSNELCLRHRKYDYHGLYEPCDSKRSFMCQVLTDTPCNYFPRLESRAQSSNVSVPCQEQCSNMPYCWGTLDIEQNAACIHFVTSGYGDVSVNLTTKFCLEVDVDGTKFTPDVPDDSKIPNQNCTNVGSESTPSIHPTPSSSVFPNPTFTSIFCPTVIITLTPTPVSVTDTVNMTFTLTEIVTNLQTVTTINTEYINTTDILNVTMTLNVTQTQYSTEFVTMTMTVYPSVKNVSDQEAEEMAEEMKKNSTIDRKSTSSYIRSLTSADDSRRDAQMLGYSGVIFVVIPLIILILTDVHKIMADIRSHANIYKPKK